MTDDYTDAVRYRTMLRPAGWPVHVVVCELGDREEVSWLHPDEYQGLTLVHPSRRGGWLAARLAARLAVCAAMGSETRTRDVWVSHERSGRPVAVHCGRRGAVALSLSHSGRRAAAAATVDRYVGVDVQRRCPTMEAVVRRVRHRDESMVGTDPLGYWTVKEAAVKAYGCGFAVRPRAVRVDFATDGGVTVRMGARATSWCPGAAATGSGHWQIDGDYAWAAVAFGCRDRTVAP